MNAAKGGKPEPLWTAEQLQQLSPEQLAERAGDWGLSPEADFDADEAIRRILDRQDLVGRLDRDVLLELLNWGHRRVPATAAKTDMVREVCAVRKMGFSGLSHQGLEALVRLRGADVAPDADAREMIRVLKEQESLLGKFHRKRRRLIGKLVAKIVGEPPPAPDGGAPGEPAGPSLKEQIEERGLVGGLADKLRGAADGYVAVKLDEIEQRIDRKLDEIDRRLAEWRDREISNRLRIIKITLVASIIVALISVLYAWLKKTFGL